MATRKKTASSSKKTKKKAGAGTKTKKAATPARKARGTAKSKKTKKKAVKKAAGKATKKKSTKTKKAAGKATRKAAGKTARKRAKTKEKAVTRPGTAGASAVKSEKTASKAKKPMMPAKKRRQFQAMLLGLKSRLVEQIATLKNDSLTRHEPINPEEDGTVAFDRQFALNLVSTERESLFEIDDALRRIDDRSYGVCEECGDLIGESRLKALPFVRMCVGCQSAREKGKVRFTPMFG